MSLAEDNMAFAWYKANLHEAKWLRDDLLSAGLLAMVEAERTFDPTEGVKFTTYAAQAIWRAHRDVLHDIGWIARLPRKIRPRNAKAAKRIRDAKWKDLHHPADHRYANEERYAEIERRLSLNRREEISID